MPTKAEKAIIARRRAEESGDVLVPLLERLLESEVAPEDDEDFRFIDMLMRARALPRRKGVFSPSMLGSCRRQAWLSKRGEEKLSPPDSRMNGFFLTGNWTHYKWQFAMWKAHRAGMLELAHVPIAHEWLIIDELCQTGSITDEAHAAWTDALNFYGDGTRPGVEVRVVDGDYGGTIDVLPILSIGHVVVDFKGIRLDDFQKTIKSGAKPEYRKQIVGYAKIANKVLGLDITDCLLVSECKAGPMLGRGSPIALHETRVRVADFEGEVNRRLRDLRWHDENDTMPAAECVSTLHMSYQGCPFGGKFCREEVLAVQRRRESAARAESKARSAGLQVARPRR